MKLYKKTVSSRETCTQELRLMLGPEEGAPPGSLRKVQLVVPLSPKCYMAIDADPLLVGVNRTYKCPVASPGAMIVFHLLPEQTLAGAAHEGFVEFSLIIEYIEAP